MIDSDPSLETILKCGRIWLRGALTEAECSGIEKLCESSGQPGKRIPNTGTLALFLAKTSIVRRLSEMSPAMKPVRHVAFDKGDKTNWAIPWHQDRVIAVSERHDVPGFGNWSSKGGVWHCEPPQDFLARMIFARFHLDKCDEKNGAMEIAVGSHKSGLVPTPEVAATAASYPSEITAAERGDVLLLPMLTLHRSLRAHSALPRRVLRVDFASDPLPEPLTWAD